MKDLLIRSSRRTLGEAIEKRAEVRSQRTIDMAYSNCKKSISNLRALSELRGYYSLMTPDEFLYEFQRAKASAILRTNIAEAAAPAMDAAIRGGFRVVEFTLTTPNAFDLIQEFSQRDGIIVGAGSVLTPKDANKAVDNGAKFLVSPVVDETVIDVATEREVAMMPGTHTATEMHRAWKAGAQLQKLFPAPDTGPKYIKAILGPMPFLRIVPTNGVHTNNVQAWLKAGAFAVGFVNNLFEPNDMAGSRFDRIEERAKEMLAAAHG